MRIAVLVPCYDEAVTIGRVVSDFQQALPGATVYVYDNNSTDETVARAIEAGAVVRHEPLQGKGNVVRRMFADIDADVYVLTDGDATYDAAVAPEMVRRVAEEKIDMVVARRVHKEQAAYRAGHVLGNRLLTGFLAWLFGTRFSDILSGYRAFSRRFVKSFPALATGFEIETELSVHALNLRLPVVEVETAYFARPASSQSKLHTYRDGLRILRVMLTLFKDERPLAFFSVCALLLAALSILLAVPVVVTYVETGLVPRLPTAVLSASIMVLAFLSVACGLILDTVTHGRRELKRLAYLSIAPPDVQAAGAVTARETSDAGAPAATAGAAPAARAPAAPGARAAPR